MLIFSANSNSVINSLAVIWKDYMGMRNIQLFILLFLTVPVFGQLPLSLDKDANLGKWVIKKNKNEKLRILDYVKENEDLSWVFYSFEHGDSTCLDNFYVVDFNNDGISDILYYGNVGGESNNLILLIGQADNKYKLVIRLLGRLVVVSENDGFSPLSFVIYNHACCAGVIDHLEKYVPIWNNSEFNYSVQYKYAFYYTVKLPKIRFEKPKGFKTINQKYNLRLNPFVDDTIVLDHDEIGNICAEYPKGSEGIAIAEQIDETGKVWWFVMMKNNLKPNWSLYVKGDNNDLPAYFLGWISKSYLEIIEQ
jgi:hypothetical protein